MKLLILISYIFYFLISYSLKAQVSEWMSQDFPNSVIRGVFEIDSIYLVAIQNSDNNESFESKLNVNRIGLISEDNSIISMEEKYSMVFPDDYYTHKVKLIENSGYWVLIQSKILSFNERMYRVLLCDGELELIGQTYVEAFGIPHTFHIECHRENIYILGSLVGSPDLLLYLKYNYTTPLDEANIIIGQSEPSAIIYISSMNFDTITNNMMVFAYDGIYILDTNLQILMYYNSQDILTQDYGDLIRVNDNYYSHGARDSAWDIGFRNIVLHKYDLNFNILRADTLGDYGHDNYPFIDNSIQFRNDEILVGGHLDGPFTNLYFNKSVKKFYLAKYDVDLNQIWRREYGGDRAYIMTGLRLLSNGECLAFGFILDSTDGYRYGYILQLDENGEILTSTTVPDYHTNIKVVNPGSSTLQVIYPDNAEADIILYDLDGREILRHSLQNGLNEFSVSHLSPGLYPYVIYEKGGSRFSGKWMKL